MKPFVLRAGLAFLLTFPLMALPAMAQAPATTTSPATPKSPAQPADELLARLPEVFKLAAVQYQTLVESDRSGTNQPRTVVNGKVRWVGPFDWTSGFFPGSLWYLYEYTGEGRWRTAARDYTARLEEIKNFRGNHDVGFMLRCSYGNGYRLTQDPAYREVLIQGARSLATRFNPRVGMIRSWDIAPWKYPVIVDNLMNLELLMWAAKTTGDSHLRDIAMRHADQTLRDHFRPDGSSFHLVDYDPATGRVLQKRTVQGAADGSAWARGQAWGLYGFTMMYCETGRAEYLRQAQVIARFILNHPRLPADKVPYWDFDAPGIPNAPRDAAAAAIMASALLKLSEQVDSATGQPYRNFARQQLLSLSSPAYLAAPGENGGFLLKHVVGNLPGHSEIDVPLNYADYYFLEALLRYRALASRSEADARRR